MWTCLALSCLALRGRILQSSISSRVAALLESRAGRNSRPCTIESAAGALAVAVSSGLSLRGSIELAGDVLDPSDRTEVARLLRDSHRVGLSAALARADGVLAPLFGRLARATMSGAPVVAAIAAYLAEERGLRRSARLEVARRLPVRLTVPLALLILPGFLVIVAGPAILNSFQAMLGPLMP